MTSGAKTSLSSTPITSFNLLPNIYIQLFIDILNNWVAVFLRTRIEKHYIFFCFFNSFVIMKNFTFFLYNQTDSFLGGEQLYWFGAPLLQFFVHNVYCQIIEGLSVTYYIVYNVYCEIMEGIYVSHIRSCEEVTYLGIKA